MKAYRMTAQDTATLVEVDRPIPDPGQVLVRITAAGLCHSDLTLMSNPDVIGIDPPITLGHEMAGTIAEVGANVTVWSVGQDVGVFSISGCGHCRRCQEGTPALCAQGWSALGVTRDGGLSEYVLVEPEHLVDARGLEPAQVAALTDAGITAYGCVDRARGRLVPGTVAVVIGIGGIGHVAVQILKATTAAIVVAVDVEPGKLDLARTCGADVGVLADADAAAAIVAVAEEGVDAAFDFVGGAETMRLAADVTRPGGLIAVTGIGDGSLSIGHGGGVVVKPETTIVQTASGSREQLIEVFALARSRRLHVDVVEYTLDDVQRAVDDLACGRVLGRAVVIP